MISSAVEPCNASTAWMVIPIKPKSKVPPDGLLWKTYYDSEKQPPRIRDDQNSAVLLGAPSGGLAVRDFDGEAGRKHYHEWAAQYPHEAATWPTAKSGGNGWHVYFGCDTVEVYHALEGAGYRKCCDGELRVNRCYVVCPPSVHESGRTYEWIVPPSDNLPTIGVADIVAMGFATAEQMGMLPWDPNSITPLEPPVMSCVTSPDLTLDSNENNTTYDDLLYNWTGDGKKRLRRSIEHAIRSSLPTGYGQRHHKIFELARRLKAIEAVKNNPPAWFRPILREWFELAHDRIRTKRFRDTFADFCEGWPEVKYPYAVQISTIAESTTGTPAKRLRDTCAALTNQDGQFFLSCRTAAKALNLSAMTISRAYRKMESRGEIQVAEPSSYSEKRATLWQWVQDKYDKGL